MGNNLGHCKRRDRRYKKKVCGTGCDRVEGSGAKVVVTSGLQFVLFR